MDIRHTFYLPAPPQRVGQAFSSEAYNQAEGNSREDVVSASFHLQQETEAEVRYEVRYVEYRRTKLGTVDRSGTTPAHTENRYDKAGHALHWVYKGGAAVDRLSVSGVYRLQPEGEGTRVVHEACIAFRVPLLGKQLS